VKEGPWFGRPCHQLAHERALLCFPKSSTHSRHQWDAVYRAVSITGGRSVLMV
jgi:hypothetical protein